MKKFIAFPRGRSFTNQFEIIMGDGTFAIFPIKFSPVLYTDIEILPQKILPTKDNIKEEKTLIEFDKKLIKKYIDTIKEKDMKILNKFLREMVSKKFINSNIDFPEDGLENGFGIEICQLNAEIYSACGFFVQKCIIKRIEYIKPIITETPIQILSSSKIRYNTQVLATFFPNEDGNEIHIFGSNTPEGGDLFADFTVDIITRENVDEMLVKCEKIIDIKNQRIMEIVENIEQKLAK